MVLLLPGWAPRLLRAKSGWWLWTGPVLKGGGSREERFCFRGSMKPAAYWEEGS